MRDPNLHKSYGGFEHREVPRELVVVVDPAEGIEKDLRAGLGIAGLRFSQRDPAGGLCGDWVSHRSLLSLQKPLVKGDEFD
jgi:hypothetical protein